MALSDPQSVTIGSAISLPRIVTDAQRSIYASADGIVRLTTSQSASSTRIRSLVRLDKNVVAVDPITAVNKSVLGSVYLVMDFPQMNFGFSSADKVAIYSGLAGNLTAASNANLIALLGGQV